MKEEIYFSKKDNSSKLVRNINLVCCIYICLWTIIPIFRNFTNQGIFQLLFIFIATLWILSSLLISRKWFNNILIISLIGSVYVIFMLLYYLFNYGDMNITRLVGPAFLYLYAYMGCFYSKHFNKNIVRIILFFVAVSFIITAFTTSYTLIENIDASRLMTSSSTSPEIMKYLESRNVAAYDFIYGVIILVPVLFLSFRYLKRLNKNNFLLSLIVLIMALVVVALSNYTTAYFLLLLAITLAFLTNNKRPYISIFILSFFLLLLSPFLLDFLNFILVTMKNTIPSLRTQIKLDGMINMINGNIDYGSVTSRSSLLRNSISSFLSAPFFGVGAYYSNREIIGIHAQFIDDLGRFGIVGSFPFFTFMFLVLRKTFIKIKDRKIKNAYLYSAFIFFLLGFMNPTQSYGISFSVFFMLPIITTYLQVAKEDMENKNGG